MEPWEGNDLEEGDVVVVLRGVITCLLLATIVLSSWRSDIWTPWQSAQAAPGPADAALLSQYGGHTGLRTSATDYFSKAYLGGKWWLADPEGYVFYSAGVNFVNPIGYSSINGTNPYNERLKSKYGNPIDVTAWSADVVDRLKSWGYNTVGSYSGSSLFDRMPHTADLLPMEQVRQAAYATYGNVDQYPILWEKSEWDSIYRRYFFDVYHPLFETTVRSYVASEIAARGYASDRRLIGYLVDNEVPLWNGRDRTSPTSEWRTGNTLADVFIALPPTAYGKHAWVSLLQTRYGTIDVLNSAWGARYGSFNELASVASISSSNGAIQSDKSRFLRAIFDRYFATIRGAIRAVDTNHLYLGSRLITGAINNPAELLESAAANLDVVSINYYIWESGTAAELKAQVDATANAVYRGAPILITEYSFGASDSGQPATHPNGAVVATQAARAALYAGYRRAAVESPYLIGDLWWDYVDPPREGSSWGNEDSNLGLVAIDDRPYLRLLYPMSSENRSIYTIRGLAPHSGPIINSHSASVLGVSTGISAGFSAGPLDASYTVFLPLVTRSYQPARSVDITFSLATQVSSTRLEIFDGNTVQAGLSRVMTTGALPAGANRITWDGADAQGNTLNAGTYYYVLKATTATGQVDYAFGIIAM